MISLRLVGAAFAKWVRLRASAAALWERKVRRERVGLVRWFIGVASR